MDGLLVVLVIGIIVLGVYLLVDELFGNKKTSGLNEKLIEAQRSYISTLEDGIEIRDNLIKRQQQHIDTLLLERRNGNEPGGDGGR